MKYNIKKLMESLFDDDIFNDIDSIEDKVALEDKLIFDPNAFWESLNLLTEKFIARFPEFLRKHSHALYGIFFRINGGGYNDECTSLVNINLLFDGNFGYLQFWDSSSSAVYRICTNDPHSDARLRTFKSITYNNSIDELIVSFNTGIIDKELSEYDNIQVICNYYNPYDNKDVDEFCEHIANLLNIGYDLTIVLTKKGDEFELTPEGQDLINKINKF